jgi:hypothetical protein
MLAGSISLKPFSSVPALTMNAMSSVIRVSAVGAMALTERSVTISGVEASTACTRAGRRPSPPNQRAVPASPPAPNILLQPWAMIIGAQRTTDDQQPEVHGHDQLPDAISTRSLD